MKKYTYRIDGSIDIHSIEGLTGNFLKNWIQDPNDCNHFIPKFDSCEHRSFSLCILNCGRKSGDWKCSKYSKGVSFDICTKCICEGGNK